MCYYTFMGTVAGQLVEDWSRFLPGALVEWAEATLSVDSPPEVLVGALMVTDVSGFTRLTAKLSRESGQAGAERIGVVLNGYISKLVDTVERLGGAILNFERMRCSPCGRVSRPERLISCIFYRGPRIAVSS
jgi:hypothetical protein